MRFTQGTHAMVAGPASRRQSHIEEEKLHAKTWLGRGAFIVPGKFQPIAMAITLVSTQSRTLLRDRKPSLAARPTTAIDHRTGIAAHLVGLLGDDGDELLGKLCEGLRDG